jgi:hypothetical protein
MTGALTLSGAPTVDLHAATKKYVDDNSGGGGSGDMAAATYDPAGIEEQLVGLIATQALTNKTIDADNNTISNLAIGAEVSASLTADLDLNSNIIVDATATKGQQLTYNEAETGAEWGLASKYLSVRKGSAGTITRGTPVYISAYNVGQNSYEVEIADQSDPAKMDAVGLAFDSITNSANSRVLLGGSLIDADTSGYSQGDKLYVAAAAGVNLPWLTATKPTTGAIQMIATVSRSNASNGSLIVVGAGRENDIPHFSAVSKFWASDSGAATADEKPITDFALSVLDDADAETARATLDALSIPAGIVAVSSGRDIATTDAGKNLEVTGTTTVNCPDSIGSNLQCVITNIGGATTLTADTTLQYLQSDGSGVATAASGVTVDTQVAVYHRGSDVWLVTGGYTVL